MKSPKAYICEFPWQLSEAVEMYSQGALLISIDPEMSYRLEKAGVSYFEESEICIHDRFWREYPKLIERTLRFVSELDKLASSLDQRLSDFEIKYFNALHYIVKITHDQILYRVNLIKELYDRGISQITYPDNGDIELDENGMFKHQRTIMPLIIDACCCLNIEFIPTKPQKRKSPPSGNKSVFSFGQPQKYINIGFVRSVLNYVQNVAPRKRRSGSKTLLSVGCKEINALFKRYRLKSYNLVQCYQPDFSIHSKLEWNNSDTFLNEVRQNKEIISITTYRGICFLDSMIPTIAFLAERIEYVIHRYRRLSKFLRKVNPEFVFFNSQAPFYLPNLPVREYCLKNNIPYFTWMHGGYGAYLSMAGYDVVDYRLCKHQVVYGGIVKKTIQSPKNILSSLGLEESAKKVYVCGSPFFDGMYSKVNKNTSPKKNILFSMGNYYYHNEFYFGHDRPHSEMSIWKSHYKIIETLATYADRYRIIIKDYAGTSHHMMWREIINNLTSGRMEYITSEMPYEKILSASDLNIFTWVSTTFFQSLYTDADMMLYDNTPMDKEAEKIIRDGIIYSPNLEDFTTQLSAYLEKGDFYQQNKTSLRKHFLDYENIDRRDKVFESFFGRL